MTYEETLMPLIAYIRMHKGQEYIQIKMEEDEWADALEKQIPKKHIEEIVDTGLDLQIPHKIYLCPRCKKVVKRFEGYCHECWQRIKWREE